MPGLSSLSRPTFSKISQQRVPVYIVPLQDNGEPDLNWALRFQYFPDTIQDTKAVNWVPREIPGASVPIYQWVSSGERLVSFTAVFTCDMDYLTAEAGDELGDRLKDVGQLDRNVDIRAAISWLRSFMFPSYTTDSTVGVPLAAAPKRMMLVFPSSGMAAAGGVADNVDETDLVGEIKCIMTQCDVTYEAFFPSGLPRIATVALAFAQIAQSPGAGAVKFPSSENMLNLTKEAGGYKVAKGYNLTVTSKKK